MAARLADENTLDLIELLEHLQRCPCGFNYFDKPPAHFILKYNWNNSEQNLRHADNNFRVVADKGEKLGLLKHRACRWNGAAENAGYYDYLKFEITPVGSVVLEAYRNIEKNGPKVLQAYLTAAKLLGYEDKTKSLLCAPVVQ